MSKDKIDLNALEYKKQTTVDKFESKKEKKFSKALHEDE